MSDWFEQIPIDIPLGGGRRTLHWKRIGLAAAAVAVVIVLILFRPWFIVGPGEVGVVLRLGKLHRVVQPGFHYRFPPPLETVFVPNVLLLRRIEVGFRSNPRSPSAEPVTIPEESIMLTGDENIIVAKTVVQYKIANPVHYLFNVKDVENTLKDIAEAAQRQVIGDFPIEAALTERRDQLQAQIQEIIEKISSEYQMGIQIEGVNLQDTHPPEAVEPAFAEVFNAREDQARVEREAEGYENKEVPRAEGEARKLLQEAEAYKAERIAKAQGEVERFHALLQAYRAAPEVTRRRLYLEALEKVLKGKPKVIVDSEENVLKFMNLSPAIPLPAPLLPPDAAEEEGHP